MGDDAVERRAEPRLNALVRARRCDEAFVGVVPLLGAESMTVRAGGVHALELLLAEEPLLHDAVVRTLATFIREHAPARGEDEPDDAPAESERPSADVHAALRALARRPARNEAEAPDLSDTRLAGADLSDGAGMAGGARLAGANLFGAELHHADLGGANLSGAMLSYADLRMSRMQGAGLAAADITAARMDDLDLTDADLRGAHLDGSSMVAALLFTARLDEANMTECDLRNAGLDGAVLENAYLSRSDMRGASLWRVRLDGTSLHDVDLRGADLRGADLSGAVGLTRDQLEEAQIDGETALPDGL